MSRMRAGGFFTKSLIATPHKIKINLRTGMFSFNLTILEYGVQLWSPNYRKDVNKIERVQRRFTRMLPGFQQLSYRERLNELGLYSLVRRRLRGVLIEVFKMMKGIDRVDVAKLFPLWVGKIRTRGHDLRIKGPKFRGNMRGNFFTQRVVAVWNEFPAEVVEAGSILTIKSKVDRYMVGREWRGMV